MPWILVAVGGALGALSRYGLDRAIISAIGPTVLGIFAINITGSFLLGLFVTLSEERTSWPIETRMLVAVGFLGSYTTFSTLTVASVQQVIGGDVTRAILNVGGSITIGLLAAFAGVLVGRAL